MTLGTLDWLLLATIAFSAMIGLWRGVVYEILSVLGWVFAFVCAQTFASDASTRLPISSISEPLRYAIGFLAVFIGCAFAAGLVSWLAKKLIASVGLSPVDRVLGAMFGVMRGALLVLALAVVAKLTPLHSAAMWRESIAAQWANAALSALRPITPNGLRQYL